MKAYRRATRVAELIQKNMAKIFRDIKELNKGLVTVTSVRLTDDLQIHKLQSMQQMVKLLLWYSD